MKIQVKTIPQDGIKLSHDYNPADLDLNSPDFEFKKPLHAQIYCYRISNTATVEVDLETDYNLRCSRCLEVIENHLKKKMKFNYIVNPNDTYVDATQDLRAELILDYSMKPLCKPDCKGLCPKCGKNLNEGKCECE